MSLYDDIVVKSEKSDDGTSGLSSSKPLWASSGIKLLQDQHSLIKKRESHKRDAFGRRVITTSSSLGFKTQIAEDLVPPPVITFGTKESKATGSLLGGNWDVSQEYDPQWPNDYEKIIKERAERKEKERAVERAKEAERREKERREQAAFTPTLTSRPLVDDYSDDEDEDVKPASRPSGAAIAPPPSLIEDTAETAHKASNIANKAGVSVVAAKMMTKMGYKEGQGLGKEEQGISRALEVEKTSVRGGKIVKASPTAPEPILTNSFIAPLAPPLPQPAVVVPKTESSPNESITEIIKNPTKVILMKNMVGPGEVDNDLEPEVKEECSKYGDVNSCVIFELPNHPPEEAVRIFVEFKRVESAIKAVVDLNGRFFGGRTVRATFFDHDRFKNLDFADR